MVEFDTIKDELLAVTDSAVKYGRSLDSNAEVEVFAFYNKKMSAEISQGMVKASDGAVAGCAARVAIGRRVGFASASGITEDRLKLAVSEAHAIVSSVKVEDERFKGFCDPEGTGREGAFHNEILELGTHDLIRMCESMIDDAKTVDDRAKIFTTEARAWWGAYAVGNSRGILEATRFMGNGCSVSVQAISGDERPGSFEFDVARDRIVATEALGSRAAVRAVALLGGQKLDYKGPMTTVWEPASASLYVAASLGRSVLGGPVVDGISPLCDMLGNEVGPKFLSIVDDGQDPKRAGTNAIDAEGHPQQRNAVIEDGVLKGFLFDTYYARAYGVSPTGNATRGDGLMASATPYEAGPGVGIKHLTVDPGSKTLEDLINEIDGRAVLVQDFPLGIFHTDVATGQFAVVANSAHLIENGELKGPLKPVSVAGNFYEGLKNLVGIGSDIRDYPWNVSSASMMFDDFSIVG
ncbi:MAG: hypothetical protein DRO93_11010 [Candidatus Thorarchaeota archaeon]|nr:MAG: hypothetical protein DRO93_11010 [Candidatus Thorarchaeota archaeon]